MLAIGAAGCSGTGDRMNIIKETDRKIGTLQEYHGACDGCQVDLEYIGELVVIEVENTDDVVSLCPKDTLVCPNCNHQIALLRLYKNLDITAALSEIKK